MNFIVTVPPDSSSCFLRLEARLPNDELAGWGELRRNIWHPYHDLIWIEIAEDMRRQGIGSELLTRLEEKAAQDLKSSVDGNRLSAITFLKRNNFQCVRHCWCFTVTRQDLLTPLSAGNTFPQHKNLKRLSELTPEQRTDLELMLLQDYHDTHEMVSPMSRELSRNQWLEALLDGNLPDSSWCQVIDNRMGYLLTAKGEGDAVDITYVGGNLLVTEWSAFFRMVIDTLFAQYTSLALELDDTNYLAMRLKKLFRNLPISSFDTYIRTRSGDIFN